jgi:hypothetical protein
VDINASKAATNLRSQHVLTTRPVRNRTAAFGLQMYPPELNVANAVPGDEISFARVEDVVWDSLAQREASRRLHEYLWRHYRPSRRRALTYAGAKWLDVVRARRRDA